MRKNLLVFFFLFLSTMTAWAQEEMASAFTGKIYNKEYDVYLSINFKDKDIKVPGQEIFGELPGFFGDNKDSRKWLITDADVKGTTVLLSIINDYGSEDLTAELTLNKDGSYTLKQLEGSTIKIARNRKWQKIPKKLEFVKK